jgi:hypothetical protein
MTTTLEINKESAEKLYDLLMIKRGQFFCEKRHRRMYKEKTILI